MFKENVIMQLKEHVCLMAEYNQRMNQNIYEVAEKLTQLQLYENFGAFFGSVFGTLNHIAVGDIIWLKRFSLMLNKHSALDFVHELLHPESLETVIFNNLQELKLLRSQLDETFIKLAASISESELSQCVSYQNMKGEAFSKNLFSLLMHVFNHQTHHRGQVTTLLSQFGIGYGVTDLAVFIPNE
jgi:uncharacterized damage-inducible protein DinB